MKKNTELVVEGRKLPVSNLDKVLYPQNGFTKGDVIHYYVEIAPVLLPHLRGRALTMKRYPDGVEGFFFYEKKCPSYRPRWMHTTAVASKRHGGTINYCVADDLPSLVWMANLADLELHVSLARAPAASRPTTLVFDLDPGDGTSLVHCAQVALWVREKLAALKLKSFAKTSGSKGLQVYAPLNTATSFERTKPAALAIAQAVEQDHPAAVVTNMRKDLRRKKVLIDWSQNEEHKTTVCAYSLRATAEPGVSTPVKWSEVETTLRRGRPDALRFSPADVLGRVRAHGDLFAPVLKLKQKL